MAGAVLIGLVLLAGGDNLPAQTSLTVGNTPGFPGATVSVPIRVARATNIVGAQFDIAFNPAKSSAMAPSIATPNSAHFVRSREIAPGVRRTVVYSLNSALLRTNGFSMSMPFYVLPEEHVSSGPLTPQNVKLARQDATTITPTVVTSGSILARPVNPLPDGTMQFFLPAQPDERYLIQATTDFVHWVNITNTIAFAKFMDLVDADAASYPFRFYRSARYDALGSLDTITALPGGSVQFQITGLEGRTYVVQASSDLLNWQDVGTNALIGSTIQVTDSDAAKFRQRFYRLVSQ